MPKWMEADDIAGGDRRLRRRRRGWPSRPGATASRSTPASTAWCASSCRASPTTATTSGARTGCCSPARCSPRCARTRRCSGCGCPATSWRRGPASRPTWRRRSPPTSSPRASTTSSSCAGRSSRPRRPGPTSTSRRASTSTCAERSRPRCRDTPVFLQGSVVECGQAEWAIDDGVCDGVEMTRAQIADPDLVAKLRRDTPDGSGRASAATRRARCATPATRSSPASASRQRPRDRGPRLVRADDATAPCRGRRRWCRRAGGGPRRRHAWPPRRRSSSGRAHVGGMAAVAGPGAPLVAWLEAECRRLGVELATATVDGTRRADVIVQCTGRSPVAVSTRSTIASMVIDVADVRRGVALAAGTDRAVRPDRRADRRRPGRGAGRPGDPDHAGPHRRQRAVPHRRSRAGQRPARPARRARSSGGTCCAPCDAGEVEVEDRFSGERRTIACAALVDCGFRLPTDPLARRRSAGGRLRRAPHDLRGDPRRPPSCAGRRSHR